MSDAVEFTLSNGAVVLVAPPGRAGSRAVGVTARIEAAERTLREALAPITSAAADIIDDFRALTHRPDEVEVAFGVVLDGKLGGIIASANAGAHLDVTLRWHAADPSPAPTPTPGADT
ncbi:CU044_2847 family protein [Streptomyces sp. NBC_01190]|uniref:CU044_2847 family protein n=1 Tax=Streptomyces sp. NBC_01190 TaxID=2903767 RepID=UPI003867B23B|nr:hypothetical protein OG519_19880 [Streptomyces sp. NBC_01190]